MRKLKVFWALFGGALLLLGFSQPVFAATCNGVDTNILECEGGGDAGVWAILELVVEILSILIGIVAVIGIGIFGVQYLTSAGDAGRLNKAKNRMFGIVIGLVVYVLMWGFVQWLLPNSVFSKPNDVQSITLKLSSSTAYIGDSVNTMVEFVPADAQDRTYSLASDNTGVAVVSASNVRCLAVGDATITATSANDTKSSAAIKCTEKPKPDYPKRNNGGGDDSDDGGGGTNVIGGTSNVTSSSYDGALGTAGSFADRTVVVTIFLDDTSCGLDYFNSVWDAGKKAAVGGRIDSAFRWIGQQMSGVSTFALTYDYSDGSDLSKTLSKNGGVCISLNGASNAAGAIEPIVNLLQEYYPLTDAECGARSDCVSMDSLREKYHADNVSFMIFMNSSALDTGGYTQLYDPRSTDADAEALSSANQSITGRSMSNYGYEFTIVFSDAAFGSGITQEQYITSVIAHELLHQFGAPDLYCGGWGTAGYPGTPLLVPSSYYGCPAGWGRDSDGPEAVDGDIMGSGNVYADLSTLHMSAITKYYTGVSSTNPGDAGFSQYGTWGASQH